MGYGPDNNLELDYQQTLPLVVPALTRARLSFEFQAYWENALIAYRPGSTEKVFERGNYARSRDAWEYSNPSNTPVTLLLSSWHKHGPPDGGKPWEEGPGKVITRFGDGGFVAGFEDGADGDYNDGVAVVQFSRLT
jgi:hypothetical protein